MRYRGVWVVALAFFLLADTARGFSLWGGKVSVDGYVQNITEVMWDHGDRGSGPELTSCQNWLQLEMEVDTSEWLPNSDFFCIFRGTYDAAYDIRDGGAWKRLHYNYSRDALQNETKLREYYLDWSIGRWDFRVGKQQVVWGETDVLRLMDLINPLDMRRQYVGIRDWEDLKRPLHGIKAVCGLSMERNAFIEFWWNPGQFLSDKLDTYGGLNRYAPQYAAIMTRDNAITNLVVGSKTAAAMGGDPNAAAWLGGLADLSTGLTTFDEDYYADRTFYPWAAATPPQSAVQYIPTTGLFMTGMLDALLAQGYSLYQALELVQVEEDFYRAASPYFLDQIPIAIGSLRGGYFMPGLLKRNTRHWSIDNSEFAVRVGGELRGWYLTFNYFHGFNDTPLIRARGYVPLALEYDAAGNPTGALIPWRPANPAAGDLGTTDPQGRPLAPAAFGIDAELCYPRINVVGATFNKAIGLWVLRGEYALYVDEPMQDLNDENLIVRKARLHTMTGFDTKQWIPWLNKEKMFFISGQLFWYHVFDHDRDLLSGPYLKGVPENQVYITLLANTGYDMERICPEVVVAYDPTYTGWFVRGMVELKYGDHWRPQFGFAFFEGDHDELPFGAMDDKDQIWVRLKYQF